MQKVWHTEPEEGTEILPKRLDDAWTKLTSVQENAKAHRKEYLDKKCEDARSQGDKPKAEIFGKFFHQNTQLDYGRNYVDMLKEKYVQV